MSALKRDQEKELQIGQVNEALAHLRDNKPVRAYLKLIELKRLIETEEGSTL